MRFERAGARRAAFGIAIAVSAAVVLGGTSGCASRKSEGPATFQSQEAGGWNPFRSKSSKAAAQAAAEQGSLGVNGFLWRASLDTLSFMPLLSADPYGGLIITDWYSNPEKADERFKATVYILDTRLRADGLNVALQKQVRGADGAWRDAAVNPQTETDLENAILTKARQLRVNGRG